MSCCCCSVAKSCLTLVTPQRAARQVPLSSTIYQSLLKLMAIESVILSNHLILCNLLYLLPSILPSIQVFSNEQTLCVRWPKYQKFSISHSDEYSGLISFRIDWFDLLAVQGTLEFSPTPQSKRISSFGTQLLYGPALTSIHDYWKSHSFDWTPLQIHSEFLEYRMMGTQMGSSSSLCQKLIITVQVYLVRVCVCVCVCMCVCVRSWDSCSIWLLLRILNWEREILVSSWVSCLIALSKELYRWAQRSIEKWPASKDEAERGRHRRL